MTSLGARLRTIPGWQVTLGVALLALGFLIAAQLRSEGPRVRYTSQERGPLVETVLELQRNQEALKDEILRLNERIAGILQDQEGSAALVRQLNGDLEAARLAAGLVAVEGPGIILRLEDSSTPTPPGGNDDDYRVGGLDLRIVVDELWLAGAEAIAVNGERVTGSTAILDIGGSILVNSAYLAPPYEVTALGPADLYSLLSGSVGFVDFVRARSEAFGIRLSFAEPPAVVVPAYAGSVTLRYGRPAPDASPAP